MKRTTYAALALAIALPTFSFANLALAEDEPLASPDAERMVISATRTPMPLNRVGNSITLIDAADLELHQDALVVDALERVPGISLRRTGGPGTVPSVFIRGANSNQTLLLIDGVKYQDAAGPNREAQLDHLPVEDIDRIEILRGPQSVLYGSDAIGGVINIITKRADGPARVRANLEVGSYSTNRQSASVRGGGENYYYGASLTRQHSKGFSIGTTDLAGDTDGYEHFSLSKQFGIGDEKMGVDGHFRYTDSTSQIDSGNAALSETESEQFAGRIAPRLSLFDGAWEQVLAYSGNQATRDTVAFATTHYVGTIQEVDWQHTLRPADAITLVLGGEWEREELDSAAPGFTPTLLFNHFQADSYAGYADLQLSAFDRVDVAGGVRVYDHEKFGTHVVGRGSAAVNVEEVGLTLRGSAGTGFKAPTLAQLFDTTFFSNNPLLEPEESFGYDVGLAWRGCDGRLGTDVSWFANEIENLIFGVPSMAFRSFNVAKANTKGIEASMDAVVLDPGSELGGLTLNANYTWLDTQGHSGEVGDSFARRRLLRRPKHEVHFGATWTPNDRFDVTTTVRWVSARLDVRPTNFTIIKADDYAVVDVMTRFEFTPGVEGYLRVDNVANENYEDVAGFRNGGLAAYIGVRLDFEIADLPLPKL